MLCLLLCVNVLNVLLIFFLSLSLSQSVVKKQKFMWLQFRSLDEVWLGLG